VSNPAEKGSLKVRGKKKIEPFRLEKHKLCTNQRTKKDHQEKERGKKNKVKKERRQTGFSSGTEEKRWLPPRTRGPIGSVASKERKKKEGVQEREKRRGSMETAKRVGDSFPPLPTNPNLK